MTGSPAPPGPRLGHALGPGARFDSGFDPETPVEGSAWGLASAPTEDSLAPRDGLDTPERDRYVSTGLIGVGGMGVVDAVLDRRLHREVARKSSAAGIDHATGVALLAHEARVTARLDHPNVVPVHDAGTTSDGRRFFTMRLVRGSTLAEVLRAPRTSADLPRLLRHLLDACRAVAHAHGRGIVHGDLKPANVLVGPLGETQVADWGLARFLDPREPPPPTAAGAGTPPWRAPEIEAGGLSSPASDVFALGVILREVLSGDVQRAPEAAPVDLIAVLRRATAADPAERYADASALGEDLARWLDGRPVVAHAYTPAEMLTRLARTWRVPIAISAVAASIIAATIAVAAVRTAQERDRAVAAEAQMRLVSARLWEDRALAALGRDDRPEAEHAARSSLELAPSPGARGVLAAFGAPAPAERAGEVPIPACTTWIRLDAQGALCSDQQTTTRVRFDGTTDTWPIATSDGILRADGSLALITDGQVIRLDPATGARSTLWPLASQRGLIAGGDGVYVDREHVIPLQAPAALRPCPPEDTVDGTTVDPHGRWWTVCSRGRLATGVGAPTVLATHSDALHAVTVLQVSGDRLLGGALDGALVVVDSATGAVIRRRPTHLDAILAVRPSPSGHLALALDAGGRALLWRPDDGLDVGLLDVHGARDAWWADDNTLWIATDRLERWQVGGFSPYRWQEAGGLSALAVSSDLQQLAIAVGPAVVVRQRDDGRAQASPRAHERVVKAVVFEEGGGRLVSTVAVGPGSTRWFNPSDGAEGPLGSGDVGLRRLVRGAHNRLAGADYGRSVYVWDGIGGAQAKLPVQQPTLDLVASAATDEAWALDTTGALLRVDLAHPAATEVLRVPGATALAVSGDGSRLAMLTADTVDLFALPSLERLRSLDAADALTSLSLDADGSRLATGHMDGRVTLWEGDHIAWSAPGHSDRVSALLFVTDGLLSAGWDGVVRRWAP